MRDIILQKLLLLDQTIELGKIYFGVPGHAAPSEGVLYIPTIRFNVMLSGSKQATLPLPQGPETVSLKPGDSHFSLANSWESHTWNTPHEILCIIPRVSYLRVSHYVLKTGETKMPTGIYYHTGFPYSMAMRYTLESMSACAFTGEERLPIVYLAKALIRFALLECSRNMKSGTTKSVRTFDRVKQWVENHVQQELDRETAAHTFQVSPSYISQLFKRMSGMGFLEYHTHCRMKFAEQLLTNTELTVYQVADQCGFSNYAHFVRRFREIKGVPPGKFRDLCNTGSTAEK